MKLLKLSPTLFLIACEPGIGPVTPANSVERKMIGLIEKFDRWDEDGGGFLDQRELLPAQKLSGIPPVEILAFYDTNKDKKISLREAQAGYARSGEARQILHSRN